MHSSNETGTRFHGRGVSRRDLMKAGASGALLAALPDPLSSAQARESDRDSRSNRGRQRNPKIVRAVIHPAIGVARVGNSPNEFYLGPEIPGGLPIAPDGYKDKSGAVKRQAARFRIYGVDAEGRIVRELTQKEAKIEWTVHLANTKAAWYDFETALDIPEAEPTPRRNAEYQGIERKNLEINPGPRRVSGRHDRAVFNSGKFFDQRVYLGEIRTDRDGRLLVLGGRGHSLSPNGVPLTTFGNNDGWTDDTSDGPVTARVRMDSEDLPVEPAWVVVGPPNYAPALNADCCTLYDVVTQTMIDVGWVSQAQEVHFFADVFPILQRLTDLQWVNQGILNRYGWGSPEEFMSLEYMNRLTDASEDNRPFREALFARFRRPDYETLQAGVDMLPPFYGDAITLPPESPRSYLAVQRFQYEALRKWAAGEFSLGVPGPIASELEDLPIEIQGAALDRAALEACLGDAFHPGCEMTWPMRIASMYASPYRLLHVESNEDSEDGNRQRRGKGSRLKDKDLQREPDYGNILTPAAALAPTGPLAGNRPGSVTRWMAVPWQTDTVSCRSGYQYGDTPVDPYLPTFWSARVPNHVMSKESYERVLDESLSLEERNEAFFVRANFFRNIDQPKYQDTLKRMVENWHRLGFVTEMPGPGDAEFPTVFNVESDDGFPA
jgi:hypothetical protein